MRRGQHLPQPVHSEGLVMVVEVRPASIEDMDAIVRLCRVVQNLHAEWFPSEFPPAADEAGLKALLERNLPSIGIATLDGAPVGYVLFEAQSIPATPSNFAIEQVCIHHLSVVEEARRQGVATALMDYVQRRAREIGTGQLALARAAPNFAAKKLFETQGFANRHIFMQKSLPEQV
jgi:GNAT superfamily N-acetyltransferase